MNDDVKRALDDAKEHFDFGEPPWMRAIRAHINGEPARIAAAREEQRERHSEQRAALDAEIAALRASNARFAETLKAINDAVGGAAGEEPDLVAAVRALRARVAELEAEARDCHETCVRGGVKPAGTLLETVGRAVHDIGLERSIKNNWRGRAEKAEAERDVLRTWVSAVSEALGAIEPVSDCRVELSADAAVALAESLRAQADPAHIHAASFAVHGALGWGFDPNTVSPVSLARAAEALSAECMGLRARVFEVEQRQVGYVKVTVIKSEGDREEEVDDEEE